MKIPKIQEAAKKQVPALVALCTKGLRKVFPERKALTKAEINPAPAKMNTVSEPIAKVDPAEAAALLARAGDAAAEEAECITDVRGSAAYKRELTRVYIGRALREAVVAAGPL